MNYYNDNDPGACAWLRGLIAKGLIPAGDVDQRSIADVKPSDLTKYTQCHFFAGIGGWSLALHLAGWPAERPVWTGSCPCQPFSAAGKKKGTSDERHLWPEFMRLIRACKPPVVMGEQVAAKDALGWLDGVFDDLEGADYTCWACDTCAPSVGAWHIRQRLYWLADATGAECDRAKQAGQQDRFADGGNVGGVANTEGSRRGFLNTENFGPTNAQVNAPTNTGDSGFDGQGYNAGGLANGISYRSQGGVQRGQDEERPAIGGSHGLGRPAFFPVVFVPCRDGKHRPVPARFESEVCGVAYGLSAVMDELCPDEALWPLAPTTKGRVAALKGLGNAIVPQVAAGFIRAYMERGRA